MKRGTFKYLEQILIDYPEYDKWIARRREEINYPFVIEDENIGGGKGNTTSNVVEKTATMLLLDKELTRMTEEKQAVDKVLSISHPTMKAVVETYYFKRPRLLSWEGVAQQCHVSERHAKRVRTSFLRNLATELGYQM